MSIEVRGLVFDNEQEVARWFDVTVGTVQRHRKAGTPDQIGVSKAGRKKGSKNRASLFPLIAPQEPEPRPWFALSTLMDASYLAATYVSRFFQRFP